jgi:putative ABC transport system permease protein
MIGLALVCMASVVGQSLKSSIAQQIDEQIGADFVISTRTDQGMSPEFGRDLAARPEVGAVAMVRQGVMRVDGATKQVSALPPGAAAEILRLRFTEGGYQHFAAGGVLVQRDAARDLGLHVGDIVDAGFVQTGRVPLRVAGIYDHAMGGLGNWMISTATFEANFAPSEQRDLFGAATAAPGVDPAQARQAVDSVAAGYPEAKVEDRTEFRRSQQQQVDQPLVAVNVLLAFALINALFGIANTMALSVLERTRELGLLRAVGMERRQVRRTVRWEAVLVSGFGAVLGVGLGLGFGLAVAQAMPDDVVSKVAVPGPMLAGIAAVAVLFGLVAALLPARRASRLDILEAIAVT